MQIIKAPNKIPEYDGNNFYIFLAGSIDMGAAEHWQSKLENELSSLNLNNIVLLNPRRDDFDPSWEQSINNPVFKEQVEWELNGLINSDMIIYYFDPAGKAPITLFELGLNINEFKPIHIYCPDGFWRKGNIEVISNYFNVPMYTEYNKFIDNIKTDILQICKDI